MVSQRRLRNLLTMMILLSLFAVACERPLGGDDTTADPAGDVSNVDEGGGVDGDTTTTNPVDTTEEGNDTGGEAPPAEDTGNGEDTTADDPANDATENTPDDSEEAGGGVGDDAAGDQTTDDSAGEDTADSTADDAGAADETNTDSSQDTTDGTIPATHTVAAGENLYRIGLKYGISWVAIANANNLVNPNLLTVGQVLQLPGATTPTPDPGPTPSPQTETTYIVQPSDNLFRIGLKFGISWVQIAEANGLVNPNLISVGDELKIPVDAPGPAPAFSHVVKQGETLFLISLQYGVAWPTIAEANNITSPYVIYVGQTLEIPGN